MSRQYENLDNFIRSYLNQDTVSDLDSDNLGDIIDLYLSEVNQKGVKQLLLDIASFIDDNKKEELDKYFERKFSSYLDISPAEGFFELLNGKYREKYPAIKSVVVDMFTGAIGTRKNKFRRKMLRKVRGHAPSPGRRFMPMPVAARASMPSEKGFMRNPDKRGARKPHYVVVTIKPQSVFVKQTRLVKKHQFLSDTIKESIDATDILLGDKAVKVES